MNIGNAGFQSMRNSEYVDMTSFVTRFKDDNIKGLSKRNNDFHNDTFPSHKNHHRQIC